MVDLSTRYLGLSLSSPLVASASPLTGTPGTARALEDAGASALVLPSLFEEEIGTGDRTYAAVGDNYLDRLETIKAQASIPVIASVNAGSPGTWARYARWLADAGADAVELNVYRVAADPGRPAADVEAADLEAIAAVRAEIDLPLAVKLSPCYSALANFATAAVEAGADGLVLFNRFYQPDIDIETGTVVPRLELSQNTELRLPLRWLAILRPELGPQVSLAATSGIASGADVVKALIVGADVTMMASVLLRHGPAQLANVERELRGWLRQHDHTSLDTIRGSANRATAHDATAFERANYLAELQSWAPRHT